MTTVDLLARIAEVWLVISVAVGGAYAVAMARRNQRRADVVRRPSYPPPVPHAPVKRVEIDAAWLDRWPSAVDDADLLNAEFTSLISTTWQWPNTAEDAA